MKSGVSRLTYWRLGWKMRAYPGGFSPFLIGPERAKAKALIYLDATAKATEFGDGLNPAPSQKWAMDGHPGDFLLNLKKLFLGWLAGGRRFIKNSLMSKILDIIYLTHRANSPKI